MYCRKCGYRLVSGEKTCQNCGEPATSAEYCGGFWGLAGKEGAGKEASAICEEEPPMEIQSASEMKNHPEPEKTKKNRDSRNKKEKRGINVPVIVCCVLLILFAVQSFRLSKTSKKMLDMEEKYALLEETYTALKEESDAVSAENASLSEELDKLSDENAALSEENARLREAPWNVPSRWYRNVELMEENDRKKDSELSEEAERSTDEILSSETPVYDDLTKTEELGDVENE